jgi:hypothetical protein
MRETFELRRGERRGAGGPDVEEDGSALWLEPGGGGPVILLVEPEANLREIV